MEIKKFVLCMIVLTNLKLKIMKLNSELFKKTFNLKNSSIYGGRGQATSKETVTNTMDEDCLDTQYTTTDDNGAVTSMCTDYMCP